MRFHTIVLILVISGAASARDEMAANQTAAAAACKAFAEAQEIYRRTDYDADGILEYAQSIRGGKKMSAPAPDKSKMLQPSEEEKKKIEELIKNLGSEKFQDRESANTELVKFGTKTLEQLDATAKTHKDSEVVARCREIKKTVLDAIAPVRTKDLQCGLVTWVRGEHEMPLGLLDPSFGDAEVFKFEDVANAKPKNGYLFKILYKQGKDAAGGARSYVVNNNMTLGYAVIAFPAEYGKTGKDVFVISNNGTIFQKDFGSKEKTEEQIKTVQEFNPDTTWVPAE
jgi:hypothetical protein